MERQHQSKTKNAIAQSQRCCPRKTQNASAISHPVQRSLIEPKQKPERAKNTIFIS